MKIKALVSVAGPSHGYYQGQIVDVTERNANICDDLVRAGLAVMIGTPEELKATAPNTSVEVTIEENPDILPDVVPGERKRKRNPKSKGGM